MEHGSRVLLKAFLLLACLLAAFALHCARSGGDTRAAIGRIAVCRLSPPVAGPASDVVAAANETPGPDQAGGVSPVGEVGVRLSSLAGTTTWPVDEDLLRGLVEAVEDVASGSSPWPQLELLRPDTRFRVSRREGRQIITESSFGPYNELADAFAAIDTPAVVEIYSRLRPLCEAMHRELSPAHASFDERVQQAIAHLLEVEVPGGDLVVEAGTISFIYVDPGLESLTDVQRHFLRMGPRNMRLVQGKLRELQRALIGLEPLARPRT